MKWKDKIGKERLYTKHFKEKGIRDDVVLWDVIKIKDHEKMKVIFESINSPLRQGVWLRTDKGIYVSDTGKTYKYIDLWYDTAPKEVLIECLTKDGFLSVYNLYVDNTGMCRSQAYGTGMLVEELENGRRYRCNDYGFETNFDKLIFRIERTE